MADKSESTDYNALAKRYLDLWQEQVAKLARDPDQLASAATAWSQMAASMMPQNPSATAPQPQPASTHAGTSPSATPASPGTPPSGPAHGPGGVDLADVLHRLNGLEKRVAELESRSVQRPVRRKPAKSAAEPAGGDSGGKSIKS